MIKLFSTLLFMGSYSVFALAPSIHELNLEQLFVIQEGFDSNDNIEITLDIKLPNTCYKVHEATFKKLSSFVYEIKAYAKKKDLSGCELGPYNTSVNVSQTLSFGELPAGDYQLNYTNQIGQQSSEMKIEPALAQTIDDTIYAPISNAFIPELIYPTHNAQVVLTGVFHNSCMRLTQNDIKVIRSNNIFIIIPKIQFSGNLQTCKDELSPIRKIVNLGPLQDGGSYLIHVRSMSGVSVNKIFYVSHKTEFNRGNPTIPFSTN